MRYVGNSLIVYITIACVIKYVLAWRPPKSLHTATANLVKRASLEFLNNIKCKESIEAAKQNLFNRSYITPFCVKNADLQTSIPYFIAKTLDQDPDQVASNFLEIIKSYNDPLIKDAFKSENGHLSFRLNDDAVWTVLESMVKDPNCGLPAAGFESEFHKKRVIIDYFGPNVAKPLHIGHFRSLILGHCIANAFKALGARVYSRNHIGDWGSQSGAVVRYLLEYDPLTFKILNPENNDYLTLRDREMYRSTQYSEINIMHEETSDKTHLPQPQQVPAIYISTLGEAYSRAKKLIRDNPAFRTRVSLETARLQQGIFPECAAWENVKSISRGHFKDIIDTLGFRHLKTVPESAYSTRVFKLVQELVDSGLAKVGSDGSIEINGIILRTRYGLYTYSATEITALIYRVNKLKPTQMIYITDYSQTDHFRKIFEFVKQTELIGNVSLKHVGFGHVKAEDNRKISSRNNPALTLMDVFKESVQLAEKKILEHSKFNLTKETTSIKLGIGSTIFSDLSINRNLGYIFSMDRIVDRGSLLIYILYAYVRARSIIDKAREVDQNVFSEYKFVPPNVLNKALFSPNPPIYNLAMSKNIDEEKRKLAIALIRFPYVVEQVANECFPHRLCKYAYDLAKVFTHFYTRVQVLNSNGRSESMALGSKKIDFDALKLVFATRKVIYMALEIMGIQTVNVL